ncbi:MAG: hypothetical protein F9K19_09035 [Rhizobiaceae bacterium]|nr:MAG: hypothetical protein F9K19_09035 [Rhizobiaceae bacterium]CAG0969847.1 hypothetical protein RHIZO_01164 [Rhizobiaceae bacterium]
MRFVLILAAMLAAGAASAAETTIKRAPDASAPAARNTLGTKAPKSLKGLKGVTGVTTGGGPVALSDADCINLQCDLKIMTSCTTRVGCSCKGTGVTICVDTIIND